MQSVVTLVGCFPHSIPPTFASLPHGTHVVWVGLTSPLRPGMEEAYGNHSGPGILWGMWLAEVGTWPRLIQSEGSQRPLLIDWVWVCKYESRMARAAGKEASLTAKISLKIFSTLPIARRGLLNLRAGTDLYSQFPPPFHWGRNEGWTGWGDLSQITQHYYFESSFIPIFICSPSSKLFYSIDMWKLFLSVHTFGSVNKGNDTIARMWGEKAIPQTPRTKGILDG